MNKRKKWRFWRKVRDWVENRMTDSWMEGGNCDSCCPKCKQWESHGNVIITNSQDDGSEIRTCGECGHQWRALFTPAGFVVLDGSINQPNQ